VISTWPVGSIPPADTTEEKEPRPNFFFPRNPRVTFIVGSRQISIAVGWTSKLDSFIVFEE
jgi:hypothetical protein